MQGEVFEGVRSLSAKWSSVVELEEACFSAALATLVGIGTAGSVALVDGSPYRRGDVTDAPRFT